MPMLTEHRKAVAWLAWSLWVVCVGLALCTLLLSLLNGRTLVAFSSALRDETDLDALGGEPVNVVRETVQPTRVALWLRPQDPEGEDVRQLP